MSESIGTRHETSLHRDLKFCYTGDDGQTETAVGGFVADGINANGEYIEIQTGSFGPLKKKVKELASYGKLKIVYPVIVSKHIEVFNTKGRRQYRRKSPRRGTPWDLFDALVYAPELPLVRGLAIEIVLVDAVERRVQDGKGSWRRKGVSIHDRHLTAIHERICLKKPADYVCFLPFAGKDPFTSALFAEKAGIAVDMARKALYVLTRIGLVRKIGKEGKKLVYRAVPAKKTTKNSQNSSQLRTTT